METLVAKAQRIKIGDPQNLETEMGPLATQRQLTHVQDVVDRSLSAGAKLLTGGKIPTGFESGYYYEPTILDCTDSVVACVQEEIFGPVITLQSFETEEEAIALANASVYGLAASIWTENVTRAHRVAQKLETGIVWVNCWLERDLRTPFGGVKQSGLGREGGWEAMRFFTEPQNVCISVPKQ